MRYLTALLLLALLASPALAQSFRYLEPSALKRLLIERTNAPMIIDVQDREGYRLNHLEGAIATHAFPVKSDTDITKLHVVLERIQDSPADVVIVAPKGGASAERTVKFFVQQGVEPSRLYILKGGMKGWTFPELAVGTK